MALPGKFANVLPMRENQANCRNCGEALIGPYCSHCGQREDRGDLSVADVASDLLDEVVSWDSRLWRTLVPLVFRPGFLTAEFIAGRRARYVPPFRLYLIISFVLFLVFSLTAGRDSLIQTYDGSDLKPGISVTAGGENVDVGAEEDSTVLRLDLTPLGNEDVEASDETVIAPLVVGGGDIEGIDDIDVGISLANEDSPQWLKNLDDRLEKNVQSLSGDRGEFIELLTEYLPQMMFLLLPVFALLLKFCYLFSPFHYLQHLVFALHFHCFAYLLYLIGQLGHFGLDGNPVAGAFPVVILLYLPMALKRSYGSGLAGAVGKAMFILSVDSLLLVLSFAAVVVLALALM